MKPIEMVGISVALAALMMTGCGSSSSSPYTGPADLKAAAEMNLTQARLAVDLAKNGSSGIGIASASTTLAWFKAAAEKVAINATGQTQSITQDCDVKGTYTVTTTNTLGDTLYSSVTECSFNACTSVGGTQYFYESCPVPSYGGTGSETFVMNGKATAESGTSYDSDTNTSENHLKLNYDHFSITGDDNESNASLDLSADYTMAYTAQSDGTDFYLQSAAQPSASMITSLSGSVKEVIYTPDGTLDTNNSSFLEADYKHTFDYLWDGTQQKDVQNGYIAAYTLSGSENNKTLAEGYYTENFTVASTFAEPEENTTISGKIGSTCLGGSVTFTTDNTLQTNTITYNGDLPYAGNVTIKGKGAATIMFDHNATDTNATVTASDANGTYGSWSALELPCSSNLP